MAFAETKRCNVSDSDDLGQGPSVEAALSMSPSVAQQQLEGHKPTIGGRKQTATKKGVSSNLSFPKITKTCIASIDGDWKIWVALPLQFYVRSVLRNMNALLERLSLVSSAARREVSALRRWTPTSRTSSRPCIRRKRNRRHRPSPPSSRPAVLVRLARKFNPLDVKLFFAKLL